MADKVPFEGRRELRWLQVGPCLVTYMEAVAFTDKLWGQWLEAVAQPTTKSLMICSWGATQPSNQQWRQATRQMREQRLAVAVVTEARHNAALAKAASWLGTNTKSFGWGDLFAACQFVGYGREERVGARAKITALRDRFGTVTSDGTNEPSYKSVPARASLDSAFSAVDASSELVRDTNSDIQARLAEVQERLRSRSAFTGPGRVID